MSPITDRMQRGINFVAFALGTPSLLWQGLRHSLQADVFVPDPIDLQRAERATHQAANALGFPMPEVTIYESPIENAGSARLSPRRYGIEFSTEFMHNTPDNVLLFVAAHEVAHLKNRDVDLPHASRTAIGLLSLAFYVPVLHQGAELVSQLRLASALALGAPSAIAAIAAGGAVTTISYAARRAAEFRADRAGARVAGPDAAISFLKHSLELQGPAQTLHLGKTVDRFFAHTLDTHPAGDRRIQRIVTARAELAAHSRTRAMVAPAPNQASAPTPEPVIETPTPSPTIANVERSLPPRRTSPERNTSIGL